MKRIAASLIAVAALVSAIVVPTQNTQQVKSAPGDLVPRFNFLQNDHEMLRGANQTKGATTWTDPVNAEIGDRIAVLLYFHNGVPNTVAHNTTVRVDFPNTAQSTVKAISFLASSETASISDTIVNGQIVGKSGLTINLPSAGRVQYVPDSTYRITFDSNGNEIRTQLPDGITREGVNIGHIQGCWQYSGYVAFLVDIKGQASLVMNKEVALAGESVWHEDIVAQPGNTVYYRLGIRNNGNATATNVVVKDVFPPNQTLLTYVPGSTEIFNAANPNGKVVGDQLFTSAGLAIPDMAPGDAGVTYVRYKARLAGTFPLGWTALTNLAHVYLNSVEQAQDQATVRVFGASRTMIVEKGILDGATIVEQKNVKILDTITYHIKVKNTGNIDLTNVVVKDVLPMYVVYLPGTTRVNGAVVSDAIITDAGLSLGTLKPGAEVVITLQAKVDGCPSVGTFQLQNVAIARADSLSEIRDTALAIVTMAAPPVPRIN